MSIVKPLTIRKTVGAFTKTTETNTVSNPASTSNRSIDDKKEILLPASLINEIYKIQRTARPIPSNAFRLVGTM